MAQSKWHTTSPDFFHGSIMHIFAVILSSVLSFIAVPLLTHYLSPGEYGAAALFQSCYVTMTIFIGLQCISPSEIEYFHNKNTQIEQKRLVESCIEILIISICVSIVLLVFLQNTISKKLFLHHSWLWLALFVSITSFIIQLRLGQWRIKGDITSYSILIVSQAFITNFISILLIIFAHKGAFGRVMGFVISGAILGIFSIYSLKKDNLLDYPKFDFNNWNKLLVPGLVLIPHAVGDIFLGTVDRILITSQLGMHNTGIYALTIQICLPVGLVFSGINNAYATWLPTHLSAIDSISADPDRVSMMKNEVVKKTYIFFIGAIIFALILVFICKLVLSHLIKPEYSDANNLITWIALGFAFQGMYYAVVGYLLYAKKNILLSTATILCSLIGIPLFLIGMRYFGLTGAAIAYTVIQLIKFMCVWIFAQRCYPMPWLQSHIKNSRI